MASEGMTPQVRLADQAALQSEVDRSPPGHVQEVFEACQRAYSLGEASWLTCLAYLTASTEYESFMELAYDHACMMGVVGDGELLEEGEALEPEDDGSGERGEPVAGTDS